MASQTALTLNTKVHTPSGKTGDIASWRYANDADFGGGTAKLTESVRGPSKEGVTRSRFHYEQPKLSTDATACACPGQSIGTGIADINIVIPSGFTTAERDDFCKRIQGLVANAIFSEAVKDKIGSW